MFWTFIAHVMPFSIVLCGITNLNIDQDDFLVQSGSTMILKLPSVNYQYRVVVACSRTQTKLLKVFRSKYLL